MKKFLSFLSSGFFLILFSSISQAWTPEPNVYLCNDCSNMRDVAEYYSVANHPGSGQKYYVVDLKKSQIRAYTSHFEDPFFIDPDAVYTAGALVDPEIEELFLSAVDARFELYGNSDATSFNVVVPETIASSAWDLSGSSSTRNKVADHIFNNLTIADKIYTYEAAVVALLGKLVNLNVVAKVKFSDGSSALYKIDGANRDGTITFTYVNGSAEDSNGNTVPEGLKDFAGSFVISPSMVGEINDAFLRWGADFQIGGSCQSGETICEVNGNNMSCTFKFDC